MDTIKSIKLSKSSLPLTVVNVKYCDTFGSKLIGLMFSKELKPDQGIILVEDKETRVNTSIHMMFMNYDLTILWLDKELVIVDKVLARKWVPFYISKNPAKFVVELHRSKFSDYSIGDKLIFMNDD
jgi:uncharacterized membrane protein (UPF0127 family)